MPPNEQCPNCLQLVEDWHIEWYKTEAPALYKGLAALDCPLCGQAVGYQQGKIGPHRRECQWSDGTPIKPRSGPILRP
jgi:hypothetical protein